MKKKTSHRSLHREPHNRISLMRSLVSALLEHDHITTTEAKAKELRTFFEPLLNKAKGDISLAKRRYLLQRLGREDDLDRLIEAAKNHSSRAGGYVRLTKLPSARGDSAPMTRVDIL